MGRIRMAVTIAITLSVRRKHRLRCNTHSLLTIFLPDTVPSSVFCPVWNWTVNSNTRRERRLSKSRTSRTVYLWIKLSWNITVPTKFRGYTRRTKWNGCAGKRMRSYNLCHRKNASLDTRFYIFFRISFDRTCYKANKKKIVVFGNFVWYRSMEDACSGTFSSVKRLWQHFETLSPESCTALAFRLSSLFTRYVHLPLICMKTSENIWTNICGRGKSHRLHCIIQFKNIR